MENIQQIFAKFDFIIVCIIVYFLITALLSAIINGGFDDGAGLAIGGWVTGCLLFVIVACILAHKMRWI
jgi:uncharacterized membrane protein required for colicin V production